MYPKMVSKKKKKKKHKSSYSSIDRTIKNAMSLGILRQKKKKKVQKYLNPKNYINLVET